MRSEIKDIGQMGVGIGTSSAFLGHLKAEEEYIDRVLNVESEDMILYHPMSESSGVIAVDASPENNNGAYTGVILGKPGIGDGETCPLFELNDYNDIYSNNFRDKFDGSEGTFMTWARVNNANVWIDNFDDPIFGVLADINNHLGLMKRFDNSMSVIYTAGGVAKERKHHGLATLDWMPWTFTWSLSDDELIIYFNGVQDSPTINGLGVWAGNILNGLAAIGANDVGGFAGWRGTLAHTVIWTKPLAPAQIGNLAVV